MLTTLNNDHGMKFKTKFDSKLIKINTVQRGLVSQWIYEKNTSNVMCTVIITLVNIRGNGKNENTLSSGPL